MRITAPETMFERERYIPATPMSEEVSRAGQPNEKRPVKADKKSISSPCAILRLTLSSCLLKVSGLRYLFVCV